MATPIGKNQYGDDIYQTPNGQRTGTQIVQELGAANWDNKGDPVEVYNRTASAGQANGTGSGTAATNRGPAPAPAPTPAPTPQQGFNSGAADLAFRIADAAAQREYLRARLALDTDVEANRKAQQEWQRVFDTETRRLNEEERARQFGLSTAAVTGVYNGAPTLAAQTEQNRTTLGLLGLLGNLRGPADPFAYLRTLQGTPRGIVDIVNAAAGRYMPGTAPSGEVAERATIGGLVNQLNAPPATPDLSGLPLAGQINAEGYNRLLPSQKAALWSAYEWGGPTGAMRPEDAQAAFAKSLPKYQPGATRGRVSLLAA